ncbi:MAG: radical SAM family heme chaperone HemW [Bacteroidales bacterium]
MNSPQPIGLYLHVPFCASICNYCNFNRGLFDGAAKARYVQAMVREVRAVADRLSSGVHPATGLPVSGRAAPEAADTIYFGGGTPSLLSADDVAALVDACRASFRLAADAEVTLEANPETVTRESMAAYRAAGVNRVSLGVQSFRDEELRRLGRLHDAQRAVQAIEGTRAAGIANVSLDLMTWLPQQSVDDCLYSVGRLASLAPTHASLYLLELYPNAPLRDEMARAGWSLAPDEDAERMYLEARARLRDAGYVHYEISNFAQPGLESRHNLKYWSDGEWLAFGCGAHSTMAGVRWKNVSGRDAYVAAIEHDELPVTDDRRLTRLEQFQEALFMGLRLTAGIDTDALQQRYGVDVRQQFGDRLARFEEAGLLVWEAVEGRFDDGVCRQLRLTPRGLLLSNEIMTVFLDDIGTVK